MVSVLVVFFPFFFNSSLQNINRVPSPGLGLVGALHWPGNSAFSHETEGCGSASRDALGGLVCPLRDEGPVCGGQVRPGSDRPHHRRRGVLAGHRACCLSSILPNPRTGSELRADPNTRRTRSSPKLQLEKSCTHYFLKTIQLISNKKKRAPLRTRNSLNHCAGVRLSGEGGFKPHNRVVLCWVGQA